MVVDLDHLELKVYFRGQRDTSRVRRTSPIITRKYRFLRCLRTCWWSNLITCGCRWASGVKRTSPIKTRNVIDFPSNEERVIRKKNVFVALYVCMFASGQKTIFLDIESFELSSEIENFLEFLYQISVRAVGSGGAERRRRPTARTLNAKLQSNFQENGKSSLDWREGHTEKIKIGLSVCAASKVKKTFF